MTNRDHAPAQTETRDEELETIESVGYNFGLSRRGFVQVLGAGLLITASVAPAFAQRRGDGTRADRDRSGAARIHIGQDGIITVLTGKVEMGQGARAELTQAAAEELRVAPSQIRMIMADTSLVPDDGITAGSRTSPGTVPEIRQAAAAARTVLVQLAAQNWGIEASTLKVQDGTVVEAGGRSVRYADLAQPPDLEKALRSRVSERASLTPVQEWKVLGQGLPRPNGRDLATGAHKYPSDLTRPGMLYGKVLRPPSYGARLVSVDLDQAKALAGVVAVQDGQFVGVAAPTSFRAQEALDALAAHAQWESVPQPSSTEIFDYLREHARGGIPANPFQKELTDAKKVIRQTYQVAYVQHAPLEPRAALAEWDDGKLTVWTGTQNPFGYVNELARAFHLTSDRVRVVVADFGSGFGGKHTGEAAVEAARLARAAARPVSLRWTREEEFTWAYFRPAGVIDIEASLDAEAKLTSWHCVNVNSGPSSIDTPYRAGNAQSKFVPSDAPLRQGSYRGLAATANTFARECCMDELAAAAGADPLEFRLAHLENARLRAVLEEAAHRFRWTERSKRHDAHVGVGLACGTEKGSFVAACVEIELDAETRRVSVREVYQAFECGAILNPDNLLSQVQGGIVMGLGPALREQMRFEKGKMGNAKFQRYLVPRFSDLPRLEIFLLNRPDLPSVGAGETPLIAIAPAIANAVYHAAGIRVRTMPLRITSATPG